MITNAVQYILDLGASAMLPVILTIFGLILGQGFVKSFRAGLTVGVGFIGINLVIGLLSEYAGGAAQAMVERLNLNLNVLDVGWPVAASITWATPIAVMLIPMLFIVNIAMLALNLTKTMDVDIWNYWHLIFAGGVIYYATGSLPLCILCALIHAVVTFKLADWTAPAVGSFLGLPGVCLPHAETVAWAPVCYTLNRVWDKIPGLNKVDITGDTLKKKLGFVGEPMFLGLVLGIIIGALAGYDSKSVILTGINMAAVLVLLPKMVALLMEGLMPISEGAREFIQKKFPGKEVYIGLDAAVATGHPTVVTVSLIMIPITIALAFLLPYNRMLPYADLAVLPFTVIWAVVASKGNIIRSVLNASVMLCAIFFIATNLAEATTTMGKAVGFAFPEGATQISGIDASCHILVWVFAKLCDPANMPMLIAAVVVVAAYFGMWYLCRNDVKAQAAEGTEV
ncbi:MAG: PTS galactitol transporter subunit IIC [Dorea sp.]|nr:PTS galactitol transporter subunit IIC [Dorea sp.]MCI9269564.1 PTS galactitol transporter subunit IIC [Dorea sp.]